MRIVVMGVSGSGKTTVGRALAAALALPYIEGDELHPPENVARMAAGMPLSDAERAGWLAAIAGQLGAAPGGAVASCSALKRSYRDMLRAAAPDLRLVYLSGDPKLLAERMAARQGHYMPASLLQSQLDTLEPPQSDEAAIQADISATPAQIVGAVLDALNRDTTSSTLA
jgi:gluconokinase